MKKRVVIPAIASFAVAGLVGCSSESADPSSPISLGEKEIQSSEIAYVNVADAKSHLSRYRHLVVNSWQLSDSISDTSKTASVAIDSTLQKENFAVDADVVVKDDSAYTVASAGVEGDGLAWMVQVENGSIVYSWRENASAEWRQFVSEKVLNKNALNNVRVERAESIVVVFVNGKIIAAFRNEIKGFSKLDGKLTIGFDTKDTSKCHCENGRVERIDIENVDEIPSDTVAVDSVDVPEDTAFVVKDSVTTKWIAEWNFNDSLDVGLDATGNVHNATIGEGSVPTVDGIARFDGQSGFLVKLAKDIGINDFVVEARVKPTKFGTMQNIVVAEPPGRGVDGWQLRIDEGVLTVHLRDTDKDGDDWTVFPGKRMALDEWCEIRLERNADSVKVFQNGELTVVEGYRGDLTQMAYDWAIGYDGMQQNFHDRYFVGEMDYVRFGQFTGFSAGSVAAKTRKPLAAWEFNEPTFVGLDRMANNSTRYVVGSPVVADSTVALDGRSGLQVNLSKVFKRNTFAIEARVKPTRIDTIQNIIVAEPPGRYGDGWMVRLDEGVLTVHFRDEDEDSTKWNVLKGKAVALDEWTNIRVERAADSVKVYQNDSLTVWAATKGDVSQLGYNIGIGYDAVNQARHNRFFVGEIDYIRYYGL